MSGKVEGRLSGYRAGTVWSYSGGPLLCWQEVIDGAALKRVVLRLIPQTHRIKTNPVVANTTAGGAWEPVTRTDLAGLVALKSEPKGSVERKL